MTDESTPACTRTDKPDYIALTFRESSRKAVDELLVHMFAILADPPDRNVIRIFISSAPSAGPQPIMYLMQQLRANRPRLESDRSLRIAVIFNFSPLAHMINAFISVLKMPGLVSRFYTVGQEDAALDWLMSE